MSHRSGRSHRDARRESGGVLPVPPKLQAPGQDTVLPGPPPRNLALDFFSWEFDAALALASPDLRPPNTRVASLQTLAQCRFILPAEMDESLMDKELAFLSNEEVEERQSRIGAMKVRYQAEQLKVSTLHEIANAVKPGPMSLLKECYEQGKKVMVMTRHARGVRGRCTGFLRGFDKHMNLILQDVEERYSVRVRIQRSKQIPKLIDLQPEDEQPQGQLLQAYTMVEKTRQAFKLEHKERKLKQIFVRGSNIVMITNLETI